MSEQEPTAIDRRQQFFKAVREGSRESIEALLREEPSLLDSRDERGFTPLQTAVWQGRKEARDEMSRLLIERGAIIDIHVACALNMAERVEALLRDDPSLLQAVDPDGGSVMQQVGQHGAVETARVLLARGADVDMAAAGRHGGRALHAAVQQGGPGITAFLLDHGADPDAPDSYGNRPLHYASSAEMPAEEAAICLRLLLDHGADPGAVDHNGHTPRRHAVWMGDHQAAALLRERGAPMEGQRPSWEPPERIVRLVERILGQSWNGRVRLGQCHQLRGERVLRFDIAAAPEVDGQPAPASVVVKQARRNPDNPYDPEAAEGWNSSWGLFEDWAATQLFASLPGSHEYALRFYGGDRQAGVIVIEDLGDGEALVDRLMGDDPRRAEEGLRLLAECVGRMHAETMGQQERYWEYRDALGPRVRRHWLRPLEACREELLQGFSRAGIEPAPGFEAEFQQLAAAMADPGPFLAYVHGDPCPDNCRISDGRLRLLDFETGGFRHALLDAVYGRILFPTCWCVNRLPAHIAPMMERAYRARLVEGCPAAADDRRFQRELVHCCAYWLITNGIWMLGQSLDGDWRWGISTWRQRVLLRLDALADVTEEFGHLPAMGDTARRCTARLREIWPPETDAMPLYPAFRGEEASLPAVGTDAVKIDTM
jgi:ankyrin repeat protein